MLNLWLLRFHRWITLIFSIPLAVLILTGLVLSFEPMVQNGSARSGQSVAEAVKAAIAKHDPGGSARSLVVRGRSATRPKAMILCPRTWSSSRT